MAPERMEAASTQRVGFGHAPAPEPITGDSECRSTAAAAPGRGMQFEGFRAWLYDVADVQAHCLAVALRCRVAADGFDRAAGDPYQIGEWEHEWAAAGEELRAACWGYWEHTPLFAQDLWAIGRICRYSGHLLREFSELWEWWGHQLEAVTSRDPESIAAFFHEFRQEWHRVRSAPRTRDGRWRELEYRGGLIPTIALIQPLTVGYVMQPWGWFEVGQTTDRNRARQLHARGELWDRILPRDPRPVRAAWERRAQPSPTAMAIRMKRPSRAVVQRVLAGAD